jgi:hypothetical protein
LPKLREHHLDGLLHLPIRRLFDAPFLGADKSHRHFPHRFASSDFLQIRLAGALAQQS